MITDLNIPESGKSPGVTLTHSGTIRIRGRSILENSLDFFLPLFDWADEYISDPPATTIVEVTLEYFNSASAKLLINLLHKLSLVRLKNNKFIINWYYEDGDEDILERGEYFSSVLKVPFNFIKTGSS
ncbi:MAG: DUF1987 domain-containing protein [Bacteroidales bacterium]|jgi:hypothetical protein|nr:DUF1987 domain-containing protein [Bacteroidales bacterium]